MTETEEEEGAAAHEQKMGGFACLGTKAPPATLRTTLPAPPTLWQRLRAGVRNGWRAFWRGIRTGEWP